MGEGKRGIEPVGKRRKNVHLAVFRGDLEKSACIQCAFKSEKFCLAEIRSLASFLPPQPRIFLRIRLNSPKMVCVGLLGLGNFPKGKQVFFIPLPGAERV